MFIVAVVLFVWLASSMSGEAGERRSPVFAGDEGVLAVKDGGSVPVAATKAALDQLSKLSHAKDKQGIAALMLTGNVWSVPSGTRCHVIDHGLLTYEVRLLDGARAGTACFVASDFVRRD